jgi:hypothetical protein
MKAEVSRVVVRAPEDYFPQIALGDLRAAGNVADVELVQDHNKELETEVTLAEPVAG